MNTTRMLKIAALAAAVLILTGLVIRAWTTFAPAPGSAGIISGNGRIEATEIDIATKLPGRVRDILVEEGDFVESGQVLAHMDVDALQAQRDEALARLRQAEQGVAAAQAQLALRRSDAIAATALIAQRDAELDAARRRLARTETLSAEGAASQQMLDDDRARVRGSNAVLTATRAQADAADAAVTAAQAQLDGARATVDAVSATLARVDVELREATLTAPRAGRVQLRVAQPGEVLGAGGRVLGLIDLSDVYMTFFVPEPAAGRIALGDEVRLVLDAAPQVSIPAQVSFVASQAQFTPKTVETASERQKLMFRVRAQVPARLLQRHLAQVKTGLPGVAWLRLDAQAAWPDHLPPPMPVD